MKLSEIEKRELLFKLRLIRNFLINNNGFNYRLYNHPSPNQVTPDSNIVEYCEDVINFIKKIIG